MANEQPESSLPAQKKLEKMDLEEVSKSLGQMQRMSEMAWAMVVVSSLDEALKDLLEAFFVDDEKAANQMLDPPGLSEFRAIELAFLLGLISARERKLLHLISSTVFLSFLEAPYI